MKKLIKSVVFFLIIGVLLGELIVRGFSLTIDVPKAYMGKDNLIKYYPNQTGNYPDVDGNNLKGVHKWIINKYGNFGYEPKSLNSLVTVIGDSYISNIMNPVECHQAKYLSDLVSKYNFYPSSRDGATFVEDLERAKQLEYLHPIYQLLYVRDGDFRESISEIKKTSGFQYSIKSNKISYAKLESSRFKELIYNFKFFYYLYRNFILSGDNVIGENKAKKGNFKVNYELIEKLMVLTTEKYNIQNIILVFSPETDLKIVNIAHRNGFRYFLLKTNDYKSWQLPNDSHWSCFGHEEAAKQVSSELLKMK